jgi:hypothetical protein
MPVWMGNLAPTQCIADPNSHDAQRGFWQVGLYGTPFWGEPSSHSDETRNAPEPIGLDADSVSLHP